jgi:hypothetical protein
VTLHVGDRAVHVDRAATWPLVSKETSWEPERL